jgi:hypothetical protein
MVKHDAGGVGDTIESLRFGCPLTWCEDQRRDDSSTPENCLYDYTNTGG